MQSAQEAYQRLLKEKLTLTRQENPFVGLKAAVSQTHPTSLSEPESSDDILEQARVPLVDDIEEEIKFLKDIKERLARSMTEQSRKRVDRLIQTCVNKVQYQLEREMVEILPEKEGDKSQFIRKWDDDGIELVCDIVNSVIDTHMCHDQLSIEEAKALRDASAAIAKMVDQYRKFIAGMVLKLEFTDDRYEHFMRVFFKVIPPEYQVAFANELHKYAPAAGKEQTLSL